MSNKNKVKNDIPVKPAHAADDSDSVFDIIFNLDDGTYTTTSHEKEIEAAAEDFSEEIENLAEETVEEARESVEAEAENITEAVQADAEEVRESVETAADDVREEVETEVEAVETEIEEAVEKIDEEAAAVVSAELPDENEFGELAGFEDDIEGEDVISAAGEELKETLDEGEKIAEEQTEKIVKEAEEEIKEAGAEALKARDEADEKIASLNGQMKELSAKADDQPQKSTVKGLALGGMLVIGEDEEQDNEEPDGLEEERANITEADDTVQSGKIKNLAGDQGMTQNEGVGSKLRSILGLSGTEGGGKTLLGMNYAMWSMIILLVFVFDAVLMNFVLHKVIYPIVSNVMTASGAASLKLDSYETLYTGISYGIAFLVGGLVLFLISKIAQMLMEEVETSNPGNLIKIVLFGLMVIFGIGGLIAMLVTHKGLFSLAAYRWICPFMGYAGGLLFFLFSEIGKKKK